MSLTKEDIIEFAEEPEQLNLFEYSIDRNGKSPMDISPMEMLREYHTTAGLPINAEFNEKLKILRDTLLREETEEVIYEEKEPKDILKELADVLYVTYGYAVTFGWDLDAALRYVHENNMGRMYQPDGTIKRREDGKIMKNKDYPKVDLGDLV